MIQTIDFGIKDYGEILKYQTTLFNELVEKKVCKEKTEPEFILLGEHYPVITLGRRAKESNILIDEVSLNKNGIKIYHIGRGGDVTYHCPGQLIVYPILDLEKHHLGVKDFVYLMEETVIGLLDKYDIKGKRIEGATGVWIKGNRESEKKICAMGIKCSHYCSMHGLALNVSSDLKGFSMINPCGFQDKGVTSIEYEIRQSITNLKSKKDIQKEERIPEISKIKREFLDIFLSLILPL